MKKKKVLSTLLIAGMVASMMVGCGKSADDKKEGSIIFFVGLTLPRYRFSKPSASLDMNLR